MYNFLLYENLSKRIINDLAPYLNSITHVRDLNLISFTDIEIWNFARSKDFTIITKDSDFLHLSNFQGCPPKVIRLICGNKSTTFIVSLLIKHSDNIKLFVVGNDCYMEIND